jgi:hypothetical protein
VDDIRNGAVFRLGAIPEPLVLFRIEREGDLDPGALRRRGFRLSFGLFPNVFHGFLLQNFFESARSNPNSGRTKRKPEEAKNFMESDSGAFNIYL